MHHKIRDIIYLHEQCNVDKLLRILVDGDMASSNVVI